MTLKSILANYAEPDHEREAQEDPNEGEALAGDADDYTFRSIFSFSI